MKRIFVCNSIVILQVLSSVIDGHPNPQGVPAQAATLADSVAPLRAVPECTECWCQCKTLSYTSAFGGVEGNCNSQYNGGRWCFVENNIGNGYSTCPDTTQSQRFLGESWSYLACISPQQSSLQCQHCNTIRSRVAAGPFNAFPTLPVAGPGQAFPPGTVVGPWRTVYSNRPSYNIHK